MPRLMKVMTLKGVHDDMGRVLLNAKSALVDGALALELAGEIRDWKFQLNRIMRLPAHDPNQLVFPETGFLPTAARNSDPATSRIAAKSVRKHNLSQMRLRILRLFDWHGAMSDPELRFQYVLRYEGKFAESTLRKRRGECVQMGWVGSTETWATLDGEKYLQWAINDSGLAKMREAVDRD